MAVLLIIFGICGALGGIGSMSMYLHTRNVNQRAELVGQEALRNRAEATYGLAQELKVQVGNVATDIRLVKEEVSKNTTRIGVLESKMDVFWRNVALDVAQVLHSPHEGWQHLDLLLDRFRDDTITSSEMSELTELLRKVKDGKFSSLVPVSRSDQIAASLLLRAIEQTRGAGQDASRGTSPEQGTSGTAH